MRQSPSLQFKDSLDEVQLLLAMHAALTGTGPGRRHNVEILNKSCIIFACAAFEAFVETLADCAFTHIIDGAKDHNSLPKVVRQSIAQTLRKDAHELKVWDLAGDGWKDVAKAHKDQLIRKYVGPFNTPKPHNIDDLLSKLVGFGGAAAAMKWQGMPMSKAHDNLVQFIELRGSLAHGKAPSKPVTKKLVNRYVWFLAPLSVRLANSVRVHCHTLTGKHPWSAAVYGNVE